MATYTTITIDLKRQQKIEGFTPETALLLQILPKVKTGNQWRELTTCKFHRYGKHSFESYRFYYPSPLLLMLEEHFNPNKEDF
jgi:hypothetical protein